MTERELTLFSAMSDIGDDLVLESGAFVPALGGAAVGGAVGETAAAAASAGKRAAWVLPATIAACAAFVAAAGIVIGVVGNAFGFFPTKPPDVTTEEGTVGDATEDPFEEITDGTTNVPTEEDTEVPTDPPVGDTAEETTEAPTEEPETEPEDDGPEYRVQAHNYKLPFVIGYCSDDYDPNIYFDNTDASPTYALGEAAFQRIKQTEKHLGVEISVKSMGNYTSYASAIQSAVMAGGSPCEMLLTNSSYGITDLMLSNCLMDLPELEGLNLKASYWDKAGMEALAVKGKQYLAVGDFLLPESSYVMTFNKQLATREGLDTHLYTLVQDHSWTLGKMAEYVPLFFADNGDGKWDEDDSYGLACNVWTTLIPFMTSSGITMVRQDERDGMSMDWVGDGTDWKVMDLDDFLYAMLEGDAVYTYSSTSYEPAVGVDSGHIFMEPTYLGNLPHINSSDVGVDVGILPYPLYDREQDEYRTLYMDGYIAVPNGIRDADMVGDTIETLAYRSEAVRAAYIDYLLGASAEERMMDAVMLETVFESLTYDPVRYLYTTSSKIEKLMYILPHHAAGVRGSAFETLTSNEINAAVRDLKAFLKYIVRE
jgi:hypothetical protein